MIMMASPTCKFKLYCTKIYKAIPKNRTAPANEVFDLIFRTIKNFLTIAFSFYKGTKVMQYFKLQATDSTAHPAILPVAIHGLFYNQ